MKFFLEVIVARIRDEVIERLKEEVDLAELVARSGVTLKQTGKDLVGRCPFHDDDTPSLVVTPAKGLWHCMGACQAGGSVIDWVMRAEGVSVRHAVELLRAGAPVAARPAGGPPPRQSTVRRLPTPVERDASDAEVLAQVVAYYHRTLTDAPEALAYLARRRIDHPEAVTAFQLGYANRTLGLHLPDKRRVAGAELRGRLERLGVFRASGHEHLAGCLVVPVRDPAGVVTDLYGRRLRDDARRAHPAHLYLPGPHRGVFNEAGLTGGEVIVTESLLDALTLWCWGFPNVTTAYGTAGFTPAHHAAFGAHGVTRALIAYDHDPAGDRAAESLAEGLMAEGVECFRVQLPVGQDVNDVAVAARHPKDALGRAVREAAWMGTGQPRARRQVGPAPSPSAAPAPNPAPTATPPEPTIPPVSPAPAPVPAARPAAAPPP
ncbi:MAG: CHC2 zinc finger domain-containing protein, partial [Acidimicrobiales bacterium]